jgi:hypothetical protein
MRSRRKIGAKSITWSGVPASLGPRPRQPLQEAGRNCRGAHVAPFRPRPII